MQVQKVLPLGGTTLAGRFVALEPLAPQHYDALIRAAENPDIWRYIPFDVASGGYAARIPDFVHEIERGRQVTFVARRLADGAVVGSSSFLAIAPENARVEIGATWFVPEAQGTAINPEAKYLMLGHAFAANYHRVEFKTDSKNARSRAALRKLGATEEGTLRGHMWMPQGYFRDSVYFSIVASEWPRVREALERRLAGFG
jgi:RimJ/RimL family protein N-acetyltransferase